MTSFSPDRSISFASEIARVPSWSMQQLAAHVWQHHQFLHVASWFVFLHSPSMQKQTLHPTIKHPFLSFSVMVFSSAPANHPQYFSKSGGLSQQIYRNRRPHSFDEPHPAEKVSMRTKPCIYHQPQITKDPGSRIQHTFHEFFKNLIV